MTELAELIRTRLLGVHPDDQDLQLEDDDWRTILTALNTRPSLAGEWNAPTISPSLGDRTSGNFIVAVKRAHSEKVFVFPAQYLFNCPLWFEDENEEQQVSGWYGADCDSDEMTHYTPLLSSGDDLMGWQELPKWSALRQAPAPADG